MSGFSFVTPRRSVAVRYISATRRRQVIYWQAKNGESVLLGHVLLVRLGLLHGVGWQLANSLCVSALAEMSVRRTTFGHSACSAHHLAKNHSFWHRERAHNGKIRYDRSRYIHRIAYCTSADKESKDDAPPKRRHVLRLRRSVRCSRLDLPRPGKLIPRGGTLAATRAWSARTIGRRSGARAAAAAPPTGAQGEQGRQQDGRSSTGTGDVCRRRYCY